MNANTSQHPRAGDRELMRVTAEMLTRDAGDDRADLDFCLNKAEQMIRLIREDRRDRGETR